MQGQLAKVPGDMAVSRKDDEGRLVYVWQGREVVVTPRRLRPAPPDGPTSYWKQARSRDTTPERALRNMVRKVKTLITTASWG